MLAYTTFSRIVTPLKAPLPLCGMNPGTNPGRHPGLGKVADYVQNVLGEVLAALIGVPPSFIAQARPSRGRMLQLVMVPLLALPATAAWQPWSFCSI